MDQGRARGPGPRPLLVAAKTSPILGVATAAAEELPIPARPHPMTQVIPYGTPPSGPIPSLQLYQACAKHMLIGLRVTRNSIKDAAYTTEVLSLAMICTYHPRAINVNNSNIMIWSLYMTLLRFVEWRTLRHLFLLRLLLLSSLIRPLPRAPPLPEPLPLRWLILLLLLLLLLQLLQ